MLHDVAMKDSENVRITKEMNAAYIESAGIEHSVLRDEVRKQKMEKSRLLKQLEAVSKSKKPDDSVAGNGFGGVGKVE